MIPVIHNNPRLIRKLERPIIAPYAAMLWKVAGVLHININEFFPVVPEASSFEKQDAEIIKREDEEGAKFMKAAYLDK